MLSYEDACCGESSGLHCNRARAGGASSGWKPRRGGAHTRMGSRESVFYDDDAEVKAAPMPSGDRCVSPTPRACTPLTACLQSVNQNMA